MQSKPSDNVMSEPEVIIRERFLEFVQLKETAVVFITENSS